MPSSLGGGVLDPAGLARHDFSRILERRRPRPDRSRAEETNIRSEE
jgi:hypothetical protein